MIDIAAILSSKRQYQSECCHLGSWRIGLVIVNWFLLFISLDDESRLVVCGSIRIDFSLVDCHAVQTRKEEKKKVMSFYLRAGGACYLYTHCQALPAPPFRCRRCAASVFAGPLSSSQVPIRRGVSGKVLFRHSASWHPAVVSKHTPPRNYSHSYARFRVTAYIQRA